MKSALGIMTEADEYREWWRPLFMRRCPERLARGESHGYHGRCDLRRGHQGVHVLERGMEIVRFTGERRKEAS